jgi:hypothetical protein
MIARAELACGARFVRLPQLAMLCLDSEGSLTNDPVHGVSKLHGMSQARAYYCDQWTLWHRGLKPRDAYLAFPPAARPFPAPDAAVVPPEVLSLVARGDGVAP